MLVELSPEVIKASPYWSGKLFTAIYHPYEEQMKGGNIMPNEQLSALIQSHPIYIPVAVNADMKL